MDSNSNTNNGLFQIPVHKNQTEAKHRRTQKEPHLTGGLDSPVTGVCECRSDVGVAESSLWRCGSGLGQQEAQRGDG